MLTTRLPDVLHHLQDALCPGVLHVNFCFCFQGVHFGSMYQAYARSCFHLGNTGCKIGDLDSQGSFVMVFPTSLPILSLPPEDPESFLNSDAPFAVLTQHLVTPGPDQCHPRRVLQVSSAENPLPPSSSGFGCNPPSWVPNPDSAPPLGASHHSPPWSSLPAMSPRLVPHPGSHPPLNFCWTQACSVCCHHKPLQLLLHTDISIKTSPLSPELPLGPTPPQKGPVLLLQSWSIATCLVLPRAS